MDRLKKLLMLVLLSAQIPLAAAQTVGETIFVHTNTTLLLTGETLYCKIYCLNQSKMPSAVSKIAYIELVGNDWKSVSRHKIYVENGMAEGYFFIPTTLKTGNYKLIAYTQWMLNASAIHFFESDISIVNPFQPLEKNVVGQNSIVANDIQNSKDVLVSTDKNKYAQREKVTLDIKNISDANGQYSVSVRKTDGLPAKPQPKAALLNAPQIPQNNTLNLLPEMRGEIISGKIVSKTGKSLSGKVVALSIPGKSFGFKLVKTDRSGKFVFQLDKNPTASTAIIQVMEDDRNDYSIVLDQPVMADFSQLRFDDLTLSAETKADIETRSVAAQVENAYYDIKKDSIEKAVASPAFFHPLEKRYVLDDYTRFPTMRETITEVVLEMYTKKSGGKSSIHLRNETMDPEVFGQPLVLIDGLLIQDTNELYDYNPENIFAIDLINQPYVYGPKTFSGVANIETKNSDYEMRPPGDFLKKVELQRPLPRKKSFSPDYAAANNSRTPDYRYQLLWQPELSLANENKLSFYTSDVVGTYEIVLEGFSENGTPIAVKEYFEVK